MTQEEVRKWREKKRVAADELSSGVDRLLASHPEVEGTDERIAEYIRAVAADTDGHNYYEILGVLRFFALLDRHEWKSGRVRNFFKFYEALRFSGINGRRSYRLTPVQCFQFASMLGFCDENGSRLVRTAYIFVPRKFSKTTSAASLAVYDMLLGDANAQAYVGANSYEQAKICFNEIRAIMQDLDRKGRYFQINREKITFKMHGRDSFIRCLTANAKTQDGLNASLVIMDEYAQARNTAGKNGADLKNVLTSSMGARRQPLTVVITTASEVVDGPFAHELEGVKRVLRGEAENDAMFAAIFEPDAGDAEDDPRTWAKVQPHLGITVQPDFYEREWATAQLSAENMLTFRTKLLNIFTINETKTWFSFEKARELATPWSIDGCPKGTPVSVGFDLSVKDDFSAVSYAVYLASERKYYIHTDYYLPEEAIKGHPNEELYKVWAEAGHLRLCKGAIIDVRMIAGDILSKARTYSIVNIGYDSFKAQDLTNILKSTGARRVVNRFSQTIGNFNLPLESFEMLAYAEPMKVGLNDNPINTYCLTNAQVVEDILGNKKPMKVSENRKIDGCITMLMALAGLYGVERTGNAPQKPS